MDTHIRTVRTPETIVPYLQLNPQTITTKDGEKKKHILCPACDGDGGPIEKNNQRVRSCCQQPQQAVYNMYNRNILLLSLSLGVVYIYDFNPWVDLLLLLFDSFPPFSIDSFVSFVAHPNSLFPQHMNHHHTQTHTDTAIGRHLSTCLKYTYTQMEGGSSST